MIRGKAEASARIAGTSAETNRDRVLSAAVTLLRRGGEDFTMRDLAAEAGVSFATPFNLFGSKIAIAQAISAARISEMALRLEGRPTSPNAVERVLLAVTIGVEVLLEDRDVSRVVIGSLGSPTVSPGSVGADSHALWLQALGEGSGLAGPVFRAARVHVAQNLALMFRGCLSFWVAGELEDTDLVAAAQSGAASVMLGFASRDQRERLLNLINETPQMTFTRHLT